MYQSSQGSLANNAKGGNAASLELPFQNPMFLSSPVHHLSSLNLLTDVFIFTGIGCCSIFLNCLVKHHLNLTQP